MLGKSKRWRDRAAELRTAAAKERDLGQRAKLQDLAAQWENLASEQDALDDRQRLTRVLVPPRKDKVVTKSLRRL
jgi:hypothetical protein